MYSKKFGIFELKVTYELQERQIWRNVQNNLTMRDNVVLVDVGRALLDRSVLVVDVKKGPECNVRTITVRCKEKL